MVTSITSLTRSGLRDWMVQRLSAVILAAYTVFIIVWLVLQPDVGYLIWKELFDQTWMRIFSLLTLFSLGAHAWIGMWTIAGDYLNERALGSKAPAIRFLFQLLCAIVMFVYMVWGVQILWGL